MAMRIKKEWIIVCLVLFSLIIINTFLFFAVKEYNRSIALWVLFLPTGIILIIFFFIQGIKFWLEKDR
jgi:hypothetical protein